MKSLYLTQQTDVKPPKTMAEIRQFSDFPPESSAGDVTVKIAYSSINYKDALAITGKAPIIRNFPMVPGIDLAGKVTASQNPNFSKGDLVLLTGYGVGENHWGGLSTEARVKGEWLVKIPSPLTPRDAMIIGTAGFTAMLCVMALEKYGIGKAEGDIAVSGAAGGVGSIALHILAQKGFNVVAITGRGESEGGWLKELGASRIIDRATLSTAGKPLQHELWAGAVDTVGSQILANLLASTKYGGAVAACGLAQGGDLPTSVMPFILRNVALLGVDSVQCPMPTRQTAWRELAKYMNSAILDLIVAREISLNDVPAAASDLLAGKIRGRVLVAMV